MVRWSAIAARLPGRTDNEIKNVWHTHLKKRLIKKVYTTRTAPLSKLDSHSPCQPEPNDFNFPGKSSPKPSSSEFTSVTDSSMRNMVSTAIKNEDMDSVLDPFPEIHGSFWSDPLSSDDSSMASAFWPATADSQLHFPFSPADTSEVADGFWYDVFMRAGGLEELA